MSSASWARFSSSQNTAGLPVTRARFTPSFTQFWIGASFTWHMRKMSPALPGCSINASPDAVSTTMVPSPGNSNVLSCEPYSSAFCAINPMLDTLPMVFGSRAPLALQKSIVAWYTPAYDRSGMTAFVSRVCPALSHIWPELRIIAGMEASMMTSDGTCKLVMPRSESTMARSGPAAKAASIAAFNFACVSAGRLSIFFTTSPQPLRESTPAASSSALHPSKTGAKNASTNTPNRIGSDTFIMVAFRCSEKRTLLALASAI